MARGAWRLSAWYFAYFAFLGAFIPYFGLYLRELDIAAFGIGALLTLMQLMRLLVPGVWGYLGRYRSGRKAAIIRSALLVALMAWAGVGMATSFPALLVTVAVLALALGVALPLVESLTLDHLDARAERYGHIRLWGSIGYIVAVQVVGFILDATAIALLMGICLLLLLACFGSSTLLPESPQRLHAAAISGWCELLRHRGVAAVMVAGFFMSFAHAPYYAFYSLHLADHGYGKSAIGTLWALGVVVEVLVFLAMPRVLAMASAAPLLALSLAAAVVRFVLIGWWIESAPLAAVAQMLHGATFGLHHAASMAALNRWVAPLHRPAALALFSSLSFGAGSFCGGLLGGALWDGFGAEVVYSLAAGAAALGLGVFAGLGVLRRSVEL